MRGLLLGILMLTWASSARADEVHVTYAGGDGTSIEKAILAQGPKTDFEMTRAETDYLKKHFPHFDVTLQELLSDKGRSYDELDIRDARGHPHEVYFDITATVGKI